MNDITKDGFSQEKWLELCNYVKTQVLQYDEHMKLPKFVILRLRGVAKGQFIANNKAEKHAEYPYSVVLLTFQASIVNIKQAIIMKEFKNEQNKFNYIMAIVENNINDVYKRVLKMEEANKKIDKVQIDSTPKQDYNGDFHKPKRSTIIDEDELW